MQDGDTEHILLPGIDYLGIVDEVRIREQYEMDGGNKAELPRRGIETVHVHGMKEKLRDGAETRLARVIIFAERTIRLHLTEKE